MANGVQSNGNEAFNGTSDTSFGKSVESQAQMHDAEVIATETEAGEKLNIYRLTPIAEADDPRWELSPYQGEVLVAARTSGDARIVAAGRELDFMDVDVAPASGVSTTDASAFRSDKLYTVIEVEHGRHDLQRGVISGEVGVDTIKSTQI